MNKILDKNYNEHQQGNIKANVKFFNFLQIWYRLCSILQFSTDMTSNKSNEEVQLKTNRSSKAHYQNRTIQTFYHSTTLQQILKAFTNSIKMKI